MLPGVGLRNIFLQSYLETFMTVEQETQMWLEKVEKNFWIISDNECLLRDWIIDLII